jgi:hypothetical protein
MMQYGGACHCGAIGYSYYTSLAPQMWSVRACQCSFCRAHGARTTSDPAGLVEFQGRQAAHVSRYRFAQRTADFLICNVCGVYIAATIDTASGRFAVVNVNALKPCPDPLGTLQPVSYDGETPEQRLQRRAQRWTPCRWAAGGQI